MNNETDKNISPARLSDTERADMLREFMLHADSHPVQAPKGIVRSPYLAFLKHSVAYSFAVFFILGGTVYAAEASFPEDLLYPLKTEVLEPIAVQLAPLVGVHTDDANVAMVKRRLEEAETLIDQGELSTASATILAAKITESSSEVRKLASDAAKAGRVSDALDASSDLETLLEGHEEVLSDVAENPASTSPALDGLVTVVESQGNQAENASEDIERQLAEAPATETADYASDLMDTATSTIGKLETGLGKFAPSDEEAYAQAATLLRQAKAYYQSGLDSTEKRDDNSALSEWREAQSAAEKGLIIIHSHEGSEAK